MERVISPLHNHSECFAGYQVGAVRARLLRRLDSCGYFSLPKDDPHEIGRGACADMFSSCMTQKECRGYTDAAEKYCIALSREAPVNLRSALRSGYRIVSAGSTMSLDGSKSKGVAFIQEKDGLKREFFIPIVARYSYGRPRAAKKGDFASL